MPLAAIAAIATLAATGTELGMNLAGVGKPSQGDANKQLEQAKEAQAQSDANAKMKAIRASLANAQEQGGGALGSGSLVDLASVISGMPGEGTGSAGKKALADYLGTGAAGGGGDNMVGATFGLSGSQG